MEVEADVDDVWVELCVGDNMANGMARPDQSKIYNMT